MEVESSTTRHGIYLIRKKAQNEEFDSATTKVNTKDYGITQFSNIAVDPAGHIFVSFVANDGVRTKLYVAKSIDGGQTFLSEEEVAMLNMYYPDFSVLTSILNQEGLSRLYPCPQIIADHSDSAFNGRVYLTWTDVETDRFHYGLEVFLSYSEDGGQSWSEPKAINEGTEPNNHQYYSTLAIDAQGTLLLSWYDRRDDPVNRMTHYYFALSRDGGSSFEEVQPITSRATDFLNIGTKNGGFGIGEYTQIVTAGGYARPFWSDGRSNNGNIDIYTAKIKVDETTAVVESNTSINTRVRFEAPYPNPSKDRVILSIELEETTPLKLMLYSSTGQLVTTLVEKVLVAGKHRFVHHIDEFTPGVYYYVLETGLGELRHRLIVQK